MSPEEHKSDVRRKNVRLGLTLGSIAVVFFLGFMAKLVFFGR
jgi:hypothetical protein